MKQQLPSWFFWQSIVLLLYIALTIFTAIHHEPWRDEAQAWLIARDLPLLKWFWQMSYEGSPGLWHLILLPFARVGVPYETMHAIHLFISYIAVVIFLYRSPFSFYLKILFVFGFYMSFEYAIIARSYSLSVLFLFSLAGFYNTRFTYPLRHALLLSLLMNTNVHSFFFGLLMSTGYLYECYKAQIFNTQRMSVFCIIGFSTLLVILQLIPEGDNAYQGIIRQQQYGMIFISLHNTFFPYMTGNRIHSLAITTLLILTALHFYKIKKDLLFVVTASYIALFYIFVFKYSGSLRHHGLLLVLLLSTLWMSHHVKKRK